MSAWVVVGLRRNIAPLVAVGVIVLVFLPLTPAYDIDVLLRAGGALLHGVSPYPDPFSPAVYSGSSFVYPFLAAVPFVPLAALAPHWGTALFFLLSVSALLAACRVVGRDQWTAAIVLSTAFTVTGLQLGALGPLLFAGCIFMWRLRDRPAAVALLAGPVIASKLFLVPLLVWLLLARRYRAFAFASLAIAAILAGGFLVGPFGPAPYAHLLGQLGIHEARAGFGLVGALMNAGVPSAPAQAGAIAVAGALIAIAYVCWRRSDDERVLFSAAIIAALAASPVLWSHYLMLLAVPLLVYSAPLRWLVALDCASWLIAPPHGVHLDDDVIERVPHSTDWAIAISLLVFVYAAARAREQVLQRPIVGPVAAPWPDSE